MPNVFDLTINGHRFTGMVDEDRSDDMAKCFFFFHLRPDSPPAIRLGGTYFRCTGHWGHVGNHSIEANQMIHEVGISFPPK